jgi:ketopantoate reductase
LDGTVSNRIKKIQHLLLHWGPVKITTNIWGYLWSKLANGAILAATALVDETIANILELKRFRPIIIELARDIRSC